MLNTYCTIMFFIAHLCHVPALQMPVICAYTGRYDNNCKFYPEISENVLFAVTVIGRKTRTRFSFYYTYKIFVAFIPMQYNKSDIFLTIPVLCIIL